MNEDFAKFKSKADEFFGWLDGVGCYEKTLKELFEYARQPAEPVAWVNPSNIKSAQSNKTRGGQGDIHTWAETPTEYHSQPLYTKPHLVQMQGDVEPVAWRSKQDTRFITTDKKMVKNWKSSGYAVEPLYSQPLFSKPERLDYPTVEHIHNTIKNRPTGFYWRSFANAIMDAMQAKAQPAPDVRHIELNDWFCSLPEGRQRVLCNDKWALANAAFEAGKESSSPDVRELVEILKDARRILEKHRWGWESGSVERIDAVLAKWGV